MKSSLPVTGGGWNGCTPTPNYPPPNPKVGETLIELVNGVFYHYEYVGYWAFVGGLPSLFYKKQPTPVETSEEAYDRAMGVIG
jgi:hypothetical protein